MGNSPGLVRVFGQSPPVVYDFWKKIVDKIGEGVYYSVYTRKRSHTYCL